MINKPIFYSIFGKNNWELFPPVLQQHYANRPYCNDVAIAEGNLNIDCNRFFRTFSLIFRWLGILIPYHANHVFTRVTFRSEPHSTTLCFDREIYLPGRTKPFRFLSRLHPIKNNEVIEILKCKIGWRCTFSYQNNKVILQHKGYHLAIWGKLIPLPLDFFLGKGYAEEWATTENEFYMKMEIRHFLFGKLYGYEGNFKMI